MCGDASPTARCGSTPATVPEDRGAYAKIGTGWHIFSTVIGAGDVDGDKRHDVWAIEPNGAMWKYSSNGAGGWLPR